MVRWMLLCFSLTSLALMFLGHTTGWVTFGVFGFLLGSVATALAFAQARIAGSERPEDIQHHAHRPTAHQAPSEPPAEAPPREP